MRADAADQAARPGTTRRQALATMAVSLSSAVTSRAWAAAPSNVPADAALPAMAASLRALTIALARAPRRRDFKLVPMILTRSDEWDSQALNAILAYQGSPKQAFDNTEIDGPWLNMALPTWRYTTI